LAWAFDNPVELLGDLVRDGQGRIRFASRDGRLFEFDERGALVRNVRAERPWSALPVALPDGSVAGGSAGGLVIVSKPSGVLRFELERRVEQVLACPGRELCAVAGGSLVVLGGPEPRALPARRAAARGDFLAVLADERTIELYQGAGRRRLYTARLPDAASAAPALDERGRAYVPLQIARSPLAVPHVAADGSVLVSAREGVVAQVRAD
jgi:hypothetical protein